MIADLIRAFVEAVVVREVAPRLRDDFGVADDAHIDEIRVLPTGAIWIEWSST